MSRRESGSGRTGSISLRMRRCTIEMVGGCILVHRVFTPLQVRTGRRKYAQMGRARDFSPENGGYSSPVFEFRIAEDTYV